MTTEQVLALKAELEAAKAENAALKAAKPSGGIKVSDKGAVSVYGLGRFPVTLYGSQWAELFKRRESIENFMIENQARLKVKEQ